MKTDQTANGKMKAELVAALRRLADNVEGSMFVGFYELHQTAPRPSHVAIRGGELVAEVASGERTVKIELTYYVPCTITHSGPKDEA